MARSRGALAVLAGLLLAMPVRAGGDGYDDVDEAVGAGTVFYGVARDTHGLGVAAVEVTLRPKAGEAVVLKTNIMGLYRGVMDKALVPEDVAVDCAKPGYAVQNAVRRQAQNNNVLVETNCTLQKQAR